MPVLRAYALSTPWTPGIPSAVTRSCRIRSASGMVSTSSRDAWRRTRSPVTMHDDAHHEPAVVVGGQEPAAVVDRERDRGQRSRGGKDVHEIVPRVGHERRTPDPPADAELDARHDAAHEDREAERGNGARPRRRMYGVDGLEGVPADSGAARAQQRTDQQRRQRFDPPVPVRVVLVGWLGRGNQSQQDHRRGQHVAGELYAGREDRCGLGQQTDDDVQDGERNARKDARQRDSPGRLHLSLKR